MALRTGHGTGAGVPRLEVLPVDELPEGVAAPKPAMEAMTRPPYAPGSAEAREAGRRGGKKRAGRTRLGSELLPDALVNDPDFKAQLGKADAFAKHHVAELARTVGGGECPSGPASMVLSAALQLAASRVLFARGDFKTASTLANDSRQNLAAAHEYTAKLAKARPDPYAAEMARKRAEFQARMATNQETKK